MGTMCFAFRLNSASRTAGPRLPTGLTPWRALNTAASSLIGLLSKSGPPHDFLKRSGSSSRQAPTRPRARRGKLHDSPGRHKTALAVLRDPRTEMEGGAAYRTRTCDPLITNEVLYQLS